MTRSSAILPTLIFCCVLLFHLPAGGPPDVSPDSSTTPPEPVVALVLEGGGALGLAHIGVITAIEALGIPVDIVVGTSMGAIVGGLYASGYDSVGLEAIAAEIDWLELFSETLPARSDPYRTRENQARYFASIEIDRYGLKGSGGLLTGDKILTYMDGLVSGIPSPVNFDHLPRRFRAVATDIGTGEVVVLREGSISDAMRASMSIPGVFAPHLIDERYLMDGGIVSNLPVDVARDMGADVIIAVDLLGGFESNRQILERTPLEYMARTVDIMIRANVQKQLPGADLVIQVNLQDFTVMDFSRSQLIIDQGKAAANDNLAALMALQERIDRPATIPAEVPVSIPAMQPRFSVDGFRIEGGSIQDRASVNRLISTIPEEGYNPQELAKRALGLYTESPLDSVRMRREENTDGTSLLFEIESRETAGNHLKLGLNYSGIYTDRIANRMTVTPGILLSDWPLPGSELTVNLELLNTMRFDALFHQTVADIFFIKTGFSFRHDFRILAFSTDSAPGVDQIFYRTTTRLDTSAGIYPFPGAMISLGLIRDWNQDTISLDVPDYLLAKDITVLQLAASILRTDSPIFPMDGFCIDFDLTEGLTFLGASDTFRTTAIRGGAYLSFQSPVSLGFLWRGGLDFSGSMASGNSAPLAYKPSLADRQLFPALLTADEQLGMAVLGAGLEWKLELDRVSDAIGIPSFIIAQGSAGTVQRDVDTFPEEAPPLYWNGAVGAGIRFGEAFGLSLRIGGAWKADDGLIPYFAIDLGAIGRHE
ncbi:MAG: patatin-like phospholipase family protein [Clostridia bacterium]